MDERLERFLPIRVVIRRHADGRIEALTEESWWMDWSDQRVRIWWSGKAYSILGEHQINGIDDAEYNAKTSPEQPDLFKPTEMIYDPLDPECPIEVDWTKWLNATTKYNKRNAPFKPRFKEKTSGVS